MRGRTEDEDEFERPVRRRRRRPRGGLPAWAWWAIGGGAALLALIVVLLTVFSFREPTGNTVTKANFARLKSGMTERQVRSIMGAPTEVLDSADVNRALGTKVPPELAGLRMKQFMWKQGDDYVGIAFANGKASFPYGFIDGEHLVGE